MGNSSQSTDPIPKYQLQDWILKQRYSNLSIYHNRNNPSFEIEEYPFFFNDEETLSREKEIFNMRKNHPQLVST